MTLRVKIIKNHWKTHNKTFTTYQKATLTIKKEIKIKDLLRKI